jgi:hypothetical protein
MQPETLSPAPPPGNPPRNPLAAVRRIGKITRMTSSLTSLRHAATTDPQSPAALLAGLIEDLWREAMRHGQHPLLAPLLVPLLNYLRRIQSRLLRAIARPHAPPRIRPPQPRRPDPQGAPPRLRLPTRRGWIRAAIPHAHLLAGRLHAVLQMPQMKELLEAAPRIGRSLRPLCRILGTEAPPLPHPPRAPRPPRPRAPRPPRWPSLTDHIPPLRPYVIAAVRAWRKKS